MKISFGINFSVREAEAEFDPQRPTVYNVKNFQNIDKKHIENLLNTYNIQNKKMKVRTEKEGRRKYFMRQSTEKSSKCQLSSF